MAKKKPAWRDIKPENTSWEPNSKVSNPKTFWKAQEDPVYERQLTIRSKYAQDSMSNRVGVAQPAPLSQGGRRKV